MRFSNFLSAFCGALVVCSAGAVSAQENNNKIHEEMSFDEYPGVYKSSWSLPTMPPAALVPMIVYVPVRQMNGAVAPAHTHASSTQAIEATHCSIKDVAVLTRDEPSCEKAGGHVIENRTTFNLEMWK